MVSGNRPTTSDHHKPLKSEPKPVGIAMITEPQPGAIACSCGGFVFIHQRQKVREDRAQAHLDKKHNGTGAWM